MKREIERERDRERKSEQEREGEKQRERKDNKEVLYFASKHKLEMTIKVQKMIPVTEAHH